MRSHLLKEVLPWEAALGPAHAKWLQTRFAGDTKAAGVVQKQRRQGNRKVMQITWKKHRIIKIQPLQQNMFYWNQLWTDAQNMCNKEWRCTRRMTGVVRNLQSIWESQRTCIHQRQRTSPFFSGALYSLSETSTGTLYLLLMSTFLIVYWKTWEGVQKSLRSSSGTGESAIQWLDSKDAICSASKKVKDGNTDV